MPDNEIRIKIRPEFTADARRYLDQTKRELGSFGFSGKGRSGGGGSGGLALATGIGVAEGEAAAGAGAGAAAGASGLVGLVGTIAGAVGVIALVIKGLSDVIRPVVKVVEAILKVLGAFLQPIADILILLLAPLLTILKPILLVFRGLIQPFRAAAYQLLAAGNQAYASGDQAQAAALFGGAFTALFAGLQVVILNLINQQVQVIIGAIGGFVALIVNVILTGLASVVGIFSESAAENILNFRDNVLAGIVGVVTTLQSFVNTGFAAIANQIVNSVDTLGTAFGVNLGSFKEDASAAIENAFVVGPSSLLELVTGSDGFISQFKTEVTAGIDQAWRDIADAFLAPLRNFVESVKSAASAFAGGFVRGGAIGGLVSVATSRARS